MADENCIFKSVKLQAGETFILPSNAELIGVTNLENIDSTCEDLADLEEFECFVAVLAGYSTDETDYGYWEAEQLAGGPGVIRPGQEIIGYELNGVRTLFPTPIFAKATGVFDNFLGCMNMEALGEALKLSLPAIIDYTFSFKDEDGDLENCLSHILIHTIPSIANNLKLVVRATTSSLTPLEQNQVIGLFPFYPLSELEDQGYTDLPESLCAEI